MKRLFLITPICVGLWVLGIAQTTHQAKFSAILNNANREFALKSNGGDILRLLKPRSITGANAEKPFIKYFWELGDGYFALDEFPAHSYVAETNQKARLFLTPCYTLDKIKPDSQEVKSIKGILASKYPGKDIWSGSIRLTSNLTLHNIKAVRANDFFVGIASFRNTLNDVRSGKLYIFYNKKIQVKPTGRILALKDTRLHGATEGVWAQETAKVMEIHKEYYDVKVFKINNLDKTARNIFMTFDVLGKTNFDRLKDLDIAAVMVLDNAPNIEQSVLTFKTASSFDPNNIKAPGTMSYRNFKNKTLKYRINFENVGNSAATSVKVKTDIPDMLNAYSIHNIKMEPLFKTQNEKDSAMKYTISPDGKFITFDFTGVDIPGAKENIAKKKTDTQGYIEYELRPKEDTRKRTMESRAEIIFDQNAPIITDKDKTHFRTGLSIGVKAGANWQPNTEGYNYFIGATYSAFKPAGFYNQIELMTDLNKRYIVSDTQTVRGRTDFTPPTNTKMLKYKDTVALIEKYRSSNAIRLVPVSLRYDFRFMSIGIGLNADLAFVKEQRYEEVTEYTYEDFQIPRTVECYKGKSGPLTRNFTTVEYGGFADLAVGKYSTGMSLGLRFNQNFNKNAKSFLQMYLNYKIL
jgi:hypothetical protein